ncbi:hypothetical protein CVS47_02151 [Microbacterium lemovicicum]|uniref:Uncharacterized protein n=1 Tax=Microbacterium lemovicicum TaxID=1072463 RepID=A0A3Q9IZ35_9MICO|nr:hypothetical protein [Microbacterium lemovicicum]AZS37514.1 hypothetical protein CVS47_02151 [Microbacterium lemovicicum]
MSTAQHRPLPLGIWLLIGAGGGVAGLLPWLITGARLPLQNLAEDQSTIETPVALLPLSQYFLTTIVALLVVGGAATGIALRATANRRRRFAVPTAVGGLLLVQAIAVGQSAVVTAALLEESAQSRLYLAAVLAVVALSLLMSLLVVLLVSLAPTPGATIALAMTAIVAPSWLGAPFRDVLLLGPQGLSDVILFVLRWLPAVLVGCAIAWCGFRTVGRVTTVIVSLAALWIGPAFFTGVSNAAGMRVMAAYPAEMAEFGIQVFFSALTTPEIVVPPLIVAAVIGVAGALVLDTRRRRAGAVAESA